MKYNVIEKESLPELIATVDLHLNAGRKLVGGICSVHQKEPMTPYFQTFYLQAMVIGA